MTRLSQISASNPLIAAYERDAPLWLRAFVMKRDGYTCQYCRIAPATELDHAQPWSRGGLTTADNLVAACLPCNREKGERTSEEWQQAKRAELYRAALERMGTRQGRILAAIKASRSQPPARAYLHQSTDLPTALRGL